MYYDFGVIPLERRYAIRRAASGSDVADQPADLPEQLRIPSVIHRQ